MDEGIKNRIGAVRQELLPRMRSDMNYYGYLKDTEIYFREAVRSFWRIDGEALESDEEPQSSGPVKDVAEKIAAECGRVCTESLVRCFPSYEIRLANTLMLVSSGDLSASGPVRISMVCTTGSGNGQESIGLGPCNRFVSRLCTDLDQAVPALREMARECRMIVQAERLACRIRQKTDRILKNSAKKSCTHPEDCSKKKDDS